MDAGIGTEENQSQEKSISLVHTPICSNSSAIKKTNSSGKDNKKSG